MLADDDAQRQGADRAALRIGHWAWQTDTDYLVCDEVTADILGLEHARWVTSDQWFAIVHPADRVGLVHASSRLQRADPGEIFEEVYRVSRPDGQQRQLFSRASRVLSSAGEPGGVRGFVIDVTDVPSPPWRSHGKLAESIDAVFAVDAEWCLTYVNARAKALTASGGGDLVGRSLWDEMPDMDPRYAELLRAAAKSREPVEFEGVCRGNATFAVRAVAASDGGLVIELRDVGAHDGGVERGQLLDAEREARYEAESAQLHLRHVAAHDSLTGLANRRAVIGWLQAELDRRARPGRVAVLFVDVDRFRVINESLGHTCGDGLIVEVGARLSELAKGRGIVGRVGGDEFVVAYRNRSAAEVMELAERILHAVREPLEVSARRLVVTASVGVASSDSSPTVEGLLRDAELALYRAKDGGRDRAVLFDADLRDEATERLALEQDLRVALDQRALALAYQPNFDLRTGRSTGAEALARWQHPERGAVSPGEFIPVAEATGLIVPLGIWALQSVASALRDSTVPETMPLTIWVNVSGRQLAEPGFVEEVARIVDGVEHRMGIEITESLLLEAGTGVHDVLGLLSKLGLKLAIDDFGTGYSGLGQLGRYPVDAVKIDRSFISHLKDPVTLAIVSAIIDVARAVGAHTVAEGVETEDELTTLRSLGCDQVCGYLLARPGPPEALPDAMADGARLLREGQPNRLPLSWSRPD